MAHPTLPIDILLLIMEVAPLSTLGTMTRTCHTLRWRGARFLLESGVSLLSESSVISFAQFMLADPNNRFRCLLSLEFETGKIRPTEAVDALLELVSHPLLALQSLTLHDADLMVTSISRHSSTQEPTGLPPLITAFSALTTLRHLTVDYCDQRACNLITAICSPLKTILIHFSSLGIWYGSEDAERRNPIVLLANLSETLEEISATNVAMAHEHVVYDAEYPSVRRVNVTYDLNCIPKTVAYAAAFPNLTHLSFTADDERHPEELLQDALGRLTLANKVALALHKQSWTRLEELVGGLPDVFILGLTCHVVTLRLTGSTSLDMMSMVRDVLGDTRPTNLTMSIVGAHLFENNAFITALAYPGVEDLRTLEMEVCLDADEGAVDAQIVLDNIATTFSVLPLRGLSLTLNYGLFADETEGQMYPVRRTLEGLDLEAAAGIFRSLILSVMDVVVGLSTDRE